MDGYSRLVAWLKVLLPLMALLLLSTLFLLSRNIDPMTTLPFAETEIDDRLREQQITAPFFSGTTDAGDQVSVSASTMATRNELNNEATDFSAQIDLASGTRINLISDQGQFDLRGNTSTLQGNVVITTSSGFDLSSEEMIAEFDTLALESPGPVQGTGPLGTLDAGQMRLQRNGVDSNAHLIFTNGVKLIYTPEIREE
ncbi:LPS export ABC transporter periplasmic protein LptC [Tateyamaria armeniaca]|uniref:LPS export ABC transporter periplasmic protein LptC n=1 Tax=Tateyamaria armeniaca TaxID=2518930 RepID=A0ABW8UQV1_9RHOB